MKITTKLIVDIETGTVLARDWYEYEGPIAKLCGGDALSGDKEAAAKSQAELASTQAALANKTAGTYIPFFSDLAKNGLDFMPQLEDYSKGTIAQSFAPAKAQQARQLAGFGDTLPDGFKQQSQDNLNASEGQAFDQNQVQNLEMNQAAKTSAASALNPGQFFSGATAGNQSILGAQPVNSGGVGNFIGGAVSGVLNNAKVSSNGAWTL